MKKNILDSFFKKILNVPLWIKQVMYLKLADEMQTALCEEFLRSNIDNVFSTYVPTITFKGKTELAERKCGLDTNIYNFLQGCADELSLIEISINTFHSMEEIAKYYELCVEQSFIKKPESEEIRAMAGFIAGKYRTGEYFKQKGSISVDQLQNTIITYKENIKQGITKKFGETLIKLGYITEKDLKSIIMLKEEAGKRFILDCNAIPETEMSYSDSNQKYEDEIRKLKEENIQLKQKLIQLLALLKKETK